MQMLPPDDERNPYSLPVEKNHALPYRYEITRDQTNNIHSSIRHKCNSTVHFHDAIEFVYVVDGVTHTTVGDRAWDVTGGHLVAAASFIPHSFIADDSQSRLIILPRSRVSNIDQIIGSKRFRQPVIPDPDGDILACIELITRLNKQQGGYEHMDESARSELLTSAIQMLIRLAAAMCGLEENTGSSALMVQAIEYINQHFREELRVTDLQKQLFCNHNTLSSQFKRTFGMSISEYINRLRVAEVRRLIKGNPDMTLGEAAELSGFGSMRTLYRVYQKEFGCTPSTNR